MKIELNKDMLELFEGDLLVYFLRESGGKAVLCPCKALRRNIKYAWKNGDFSGKQGELFLYYPSAAKKDIKHNLAANRVLAIGLGKISDNADALREQLRQAAGTAARQAAKLQVKNMLLVLPENISLPDADIAECLSESLVLASYSFDCHKSKKKDDEPASKLEKVYLHVGDMKAEAVKQGLSQGERAAQAACIARDMANEPGNVWTPKRFAEFGEKLAKDHDLECTVLSRPEMKKLGMGGLLGVSQGSIQPAKLVILRYQGGGDKDKKTPTLMLVGKGLTFDAGGISLKPPQKMEEMKYDMCGGAAVICAMQAIAEEKPKGINVVALIPASENMPSGAALKPGDIITHYGGITSEIINTDAEGRLILADALAYGIETWKPDAVIDLATLTGAVIVGLGHHRTGLLANDDGLAEQLLAAGGRAGEPLWRLPLGPEYSKQIKSTVADIKNSGGREAGTITAAAYLQEFVGNTPWAHLDIAGTAWDFTEKSYIPKGPSGIAVRTLLNFVRSWQPGEKEK
ncbi:putative cytosol aminopeptidase [Candidatus Electronema halotolerans]